MTDYESRLSISLAGNPRENFFTRSGVLIAEGYSRVVLGDRGPYIEFHCSNMRNSALRGTDVEHYYYIEMRTIPDDVKVYWQVHPVNYADYRPGLIYVSPFELYTNDGEVIIKPL